jgi:hypothetical protein
VLERLEAAVLGHAALGDVELAQHLDARDRLLGLRAVLDQLDLREDAVDAELDREARGQRLEVDVARADLAARRAAWSAPGAPPRSSRRRSP